MGMIDRLIERSLRHRLLVLLGVLLLIGFGTWSFLKIPLDAFPDVTNIQVEVLSSAPGLAPLEVEKFVTYPVETTLRGLPRLSLLRSVSKFGLSVVTVVFEDGMDVYFARQLVLERLIEAREKVPRGIEIAMGPVSTAMGEIYQYTLEGGGTGMEAAGVERLTELRTVQDWILAPLLKSVPGVSEINSFGGYVHQYEVTADPDLLLKYDLTLADLAPALEKNNLNVGGNILEEPWGRPWSAASAFCGRRPTWSGSSSSPSRGPRSCSATWLRPGPARPSARERRSRTAAGKSSAGWS